jgi:hypothetical protein
MSVPLRVSLCSIFFSIVLYSFESSAFATGIPSEFPLVFCHHLSPSAWIHGSQEDLVSSTYVSLLVFRIGGMDRLFCLTVSWNPRRNYNSSGRIGDSWKRFELIVRLQLGTVRTSSTCSICNLPTSTRVGHIFNHCKTWSRISSGTYTNELALRFVYVRITLAIILPGWQLRVRSGGVDPCCSPLFNSRNLNFPKFQFHLHFAFAARASKSDEQYEVSIQQNKGNSTNLLNVSEIEG